MAWNSEFCLNPVKQLIRNGQTLVWEDGTHIGIGIDISERKQAEEALKESEERFELAMKFANEGLYDWDLETNEIYYSPGWKRLMGYEDEEIKNEFSEWERLTKSEDVKASWTMLNEILNGKRDHFEQEFQMLHKDGHWIDILSRANVVFDENGKGIRVLGTHVDITGRKQAEEALRNSNATLELAQKMAGLGYWSYDIETEMPTWSREMYVVFGVDPEQGQPSYEDHKKNWHPDDWDMFDQAVQDAIQLGKSYNIVIRIIFPDHSIHYVNTQGYPRYDEKGKITELYGTSQDITERMQKEEERKQLQDKLQRAQKMEAMGLMAGGVAHDLNNILSGIVSYPELLLLDLPEDSPLRNPIKTIQESGMRATDVVEDLLTVARGVTTSKEVLNLNAMIEEYMDSGEQQKLRQIRPLSTYRTELDSELLNITGSASHIKKILMNLVTNASEAIDNAGTVVISAMNRYLDEPLKGYEDVIIGEYVLLTVSDDGSGISSGDLERIFEPFYTKKVMGKSGTGLGLAVVWNSMQNHDGYINVKSNEKGTVFELYFPVTREELAAEKEEVPLAEYKGHGEKILVVDDEERQREIASGILTRLGYNAEAVSSGEEAIEYVKENAVDLIVLDMVMPKGINGRKTYEEIIKIHPGQKAIIASGYAKTKEVDLAQELGAGKYIKKPYTLPKVGLAVKEELEK